MSTIKAKNIKQTVIGGTTQPLKIGGILEDGSDAKITIDTSGNTTLSQVIGIKFPATQVPSTDANTLDDYEEGTFTPYIYGTTLAGVGTYVNQYGRYTKIGNLVHVSGWLDWSSHTGTGDMKIGGLPLSVLNSGFINANILSQNVTVPANNLFSGGYVGNGTTIVNLTSTTIATGITNMVSMDSSAWLMFNFVYETA